MKLLFLGVSSALSVGRNKFQSNMLLESDSGKKLLIDCGGDIRHSLYAQGYRHEDIHAVYISHLHSDHVGGLEWLGFAKHFIERSRPELYISADQASTLWRNVLSGGMSSLESQKATLRTFFNVKKINQLQFDWEDISFHLVKTYHAFNKHTLLPSYGLLFKQNSKHFFVSSDTRLHLDSLMPVFEKADMIFQDCETSVTASGQHARYEELCQLPPAIKNKMWLYDYNDGTLPDAEKDGFLGLVKQGQHFYL